MKKIVLLLTLCAVCSLNAQNIADDRHAQSSLLLPVDNINFNTANGNLSAQYTYGLPSLVHITTTTPPDSIELSRLVLGIKANGKCSDNVATLFKTGYFTPQSAIDFKFGYRGFATRGRYSKIKTIKANQQEAKGNYDMIVRNRQTIILILGNIKLNLASDTAASDQAKADEAKKQYKWVDKSLTPAVNDEQKLGDLIASFWKTTDTTAIKNQGLSNLVRGLIQVEQLLHSNSVLDTQNNILGTSIHNLRNDLATNGYDQFVVYAGASREARSFYLIQENALYLDGRYYKHTFAGSRLYIGVNLYLKSKMVIGFQAGWHHSDNYDDLTILEIESTTVFTDANRTDKNTKKFNAVSGKYHEFDQFTLAADITRFYELPGKNINQGAVSFYGRAMFRDEPEFDLKNNYATGASFSFTNSANSKFVGAIYVQHEWPKAEGDVRNWYNRLTLGVTTTFNFGYINYNDMFE